MPPKTKDRQWVNLALPAELHARVKSAANAEDRSVSSYLVRLIAEHTPMSLTRNIIEGYAPGASLPIRITAKKYLSREEALEFARNAGIRGPINLITFSPDGAELVCAVGTVE